MTQKGILQTAQEQLATDLNCSPEDLMNEKDTFVFTEVKNNPGRRPFPRDERHFEMATMGRAIVITATPDILHIIKPMLDGKSRDEAFAMPFVYSHTLAYLPDLKSLKPITPPEGFEYEMVEQDGIPVLYAAKGFENAIQYDTNRPRPDTLVWLAKKDGKIVGMSGASIDCAKMWQVGIDILPGYRNNNLAAYLVTQLTLEILNRGYVPYYCTSVSNVASQRVAHRSGYAPAWACAFKGIEAQFDLNDGAFTKGALPSRQASAHPILKVRLNCVDFCGNARKYRRSLPIRQARRC